MGASLRLVPHEHAARRPLRPGSKIYAATGRRFLRLPRLRRAQHASRRLQGQFGSRSIPRSSLAMETRTRHAKKLGQFPSRRLRAPEEKLQSDLGNSPKPANPRPKLPLFQPDSKRLPNPVTNHFLRSRQTPSFVAARFSVASYSVIAPPTGSAKALLPCINAWAPTGKSKSNLGGSSLRQHSQNSGQGRALWQCSERICGIARNPRRQEGFRDWRRAVTHEQRSLQPHPP